MPTFPTQAMHAHLVIPDLFLPREAAAEGYAGLHLPKLKKMLARGEAAALAEKSLDAWLCAAFGAEGVAPVALLGDGGQPGQAYWLRADPVHLMLRGSEVVLHPVASVTAAEATQMCESLNRHFDAEGLYFTAPQPQRWYLRLECAPAISFHSVAQVAARDIRAFLPYGADALRWHTLLNEIQMLLTGHAVNLARAARGDWVINSIWPWGGGHAPAGMRRPCARMYGDSPLAAAFARAAGVQPLPLPDNGAEWRPRMDGEMLLVWDGLRRALEHGDLGEWRDSLQRLERNVAAPLLRELQRGRLARITVDALHEAGSRRFTLTRRDAWKFWRGPGRLEYHVP